MKNRSIWPALASMLVVVALLIALAGLAPASADAGGMMGSKTGDLNMDGVANSLDALLVLFYGANLGAPPADPDAWTASADVDCDLAVTALDAALILQADAGLYELRA